MFTKSSIFICQCSVFSTTKIGVKFVSTLIKALAVSKQPNKGLLLLLNLLKEVKQQSLANMLIAKRIIVQNHTIGYVKESVKLVFN